MDSKYKIIALGGLDENGKNSYLIETKESIILLDAGLANFTNKTLGIDYVICDYSYLEENIKKVKAVFISHGHLDQMGAISHLLETIKVPIYGSNYTIKFLKSYVDKKDHKHLKEIRYNTAIKLDDLVVECFTLSHAIYGNLGFVVACGKEALVYTTDFNFDQTKSKFGRTDIAKIAKLAAKYQIKALMIETTALDEYATTINEATYMQAFNRTVESTKGRLIITLYSSNLSGMTNIIRMAETHEKKIVIIGRDLLSYVNISRELGYISHQKDIFVRISDMKKYQDEQIIIVVAGLYGEPFYEIEKMAKGLHSIIRLKETDRILIASKAYDEIESHAQQILDIVGRRTTDIIQQTINVSAHCKQEDAKLMINLFEPEYIIPIKGEYRKFIELRNVAMAIGYEAEKVRIIKNGDILNIDENYALVDKRIKLQQQLISKQSEKNIDPIILKDREILSDNGYVTIVLMFKRGTDEIIQEPQIISGGLIQFDDDENLMEGCMKIVKREIAEMENNRQLVNKLKIKISRYLNNNIGKTPMILPLRVEIDPRNINKKG
ncbi:MAG: ribonuclease J [Mycoplasmatales bacterium]